MKPFGELRRLEEEGKLDRRGERIVRHRNALVWQGLLFGLAVSLGLMLPLSQYECLAEQIYTGVNLAGAEFGEDSLPGTIGENYSYPLPEEVDYFLSKGMNIFRLPFRWERLQQSLNADFDVTELGRLDAVVSYATRQGARVVLDPHNYARYHGELIGSKSVPNAAFADFWSRLASKYKDNDRVIFGLMNEPNTMPSEQWRAAANIAIAAIRNTGANHLILVPGNAWSGAYSWNHEWYGTPNSKEMLKIVDPENNFAYDVHQYLDKDSSGTTSDIVDVAIGQQRLVSVTDWLRKHNRQAFLGEFAVANSTIGSGVGDEAITQMLSYMQTNDDVWIGWTWWAGGPRWGEYRFTLEPKNLGEPDESDRPALAVLEPYLVGASNAKGEP